MRLSKIAMEEIANKRQDYTKAILDRDGLSQDPIILFERWYQDAEKAGIIEPNAMSLATSSKSGHPSIRMVLLKGFDPQGFVFYSNYTSRKGQELTENPQAALLFWWKELERQVRIEGEIEKTSLEQSQGYFNSRPRGSQISAWSSPQSQEIKEHYLTDKRQEVEQRFADEDVIPLPPHWGGYLLKPAVLEFWQGRESRYHDRFRYRHSDDGSWVVDRLAP